MTTVYDAFFPVQLLCLSHINLDFTSFFFINSKSVTLLSQFVVMYYPPVPTYTNSFAFNCFM